MSSQTLETAEDSSASTTPLFWYFRTNPSEHAFAQDQELPSSTTCLAFKSALIANEARTSQPRLVLDPELQCIKDLQTPSCRESWPLSWFQETTDLPGPTEMTRFQEACITHLDFQCSILTTLDKQEVAMARPPIALALAALGAALVDSSKFKDIWIHAHRMLISGFAINNQMTRNHYSYLAWLLIDMAAIVAADPDIARLANITQGMIKTAMRRCWQGYQIQPSSHHHVSILGQLLPCLLEADLVRSLRMHAVPTTISAFGTVPLNSASNLTLKNIAASTFNHHDPKATDRGQEIAFLKLLIILNELVMHALVLNRLMGESPSCTAAIMSLSVKEEIRRSRNRIEHALSAWHADNFSHAEIQVQALYQFCKLYLLMPHLHLLPTDARHNTSVNLQCGSGFTSARQSRLEWRSQDSPATMVHHAWLLYESVSRIPSDSAALHCLYLPVITLLAGLCVWNDIRAQGNSRAHGSTNVLRLFSFEIRRMPWPCCREMADCLDSLT